MSNLASQMAAVAKQMKANFTLKGRPVAYSEMFSETGLMPGLVKRAEQLASLCFGYGLGSKIEDQEKTLLGTKVSFDEFTPDVLRVFCLTDVLFELVRSSPQRDAVPMDELMYD